MAVANEWIKKSYTGGAVATTLNGAIAGGTTAIVLTNGSTYPDGTGGPFVICMDRGLGTEEKVICSARSGNNVTVLQRGYDGTAAVGHANLAPVEHVLDAWSIDQAAAAAAAATTVGDLSIRSGALAYARLAPGAAGVPIVSNGAGVAPSYGQIAAAGVSAAAITAITAGLATTAAMNAADAAEAATRASADANPARAGLGISRVAAFSIGSGATLAMPWDTENWDTAGYFSPTNTSIGMPVGTAGLYLITSQIIPDSAGPNILAALMLDGIINAEFCFVGPALTAGGSVAILSTLLIVGAGSTLSVNVKNNSGSSRTFTGKFTMHRISV